VCTALPLMFTVAGSPPAGAPGPTTGSATISATTAAKPKVTLIVSPGSLAFGDLYPESSSTQPVSVTIKHNVPVTISVSASTITGTTLGNTMAFSALSLNSTAFDASGNGPTATLSNRGVDDRTENFAVTIPWDAVPDTYSTTITYTVTGS